MADDSCKTKYPVMLVHGTGFRDWKLPLYWGRIPKALCERGADVHFGMQDGWAPTRVNAEHLCARIERVLSDTGAEKVNLIGHSKGGLECRMVASSLGYGAQIASITSIGTPHRGSRTMDRLLHAPQRAFSLAAFAVNNWTRVLGDRDPDFAAVCREFASAHMERFNLDNPDHPAVYYQSYAGWMRRPLSDIHLALGNFIVGHIEGANDGMVTVESARWGERFTLLESAGRGISHLDEIDFRRAAFSKKRVPEKVCDIAEVYIAIVADLKQGGF